MVNKIRDFLCNTDPVALGAIAVVILLLAALIIFFPIELFLIIVVASFASMAILGSIVGLGKLFGKLQEKCKRDD